MKILIMSATEEGEKHNPDFVKESLDDLLFSSVHRTPNQTPMFEQENKMSKKKGGFLFQNQTWQRKAG